MALCVFAAGLLSVANAITLKLNSNNKKVCFYIRGEAVDSEFILNYGYSGDGYDQCRTRVGLADPSSRTSKRRPASMTSNPAIRPPSMATSPPIFKRIRCTASASRAWTITKSRSPSTTRRRRGRSTSPKVRSTDVDDMNNAEVTIGEIIENQIKLDTRLSYFQSNIFTHTQSSRPLTSHGEPQEQLDLEQSYQAGRHAPGRRHPGQPPGRATGGYQVQDHRYTLINSVNNI
jgi:hypothetical protein